MKQPRLVKPAASPSLPHTADKPIAEERHNVDTVRVRDFAKLLLPWYETAKRDLPWRRSDGDPYAVWISEIMLQQTTVAAVIPFFNRWMISFPTVQALAAADIEDVLKHWAGLGYYARARNLHRAAQKIVAEYGGVLPASAAELRTLPGIGRYTSGAIASIAYNQNEPLVDANVARVLSRVFGLLEDMKTSAAAAEKVWSIAEAVIPDGHAGDFNQAMMELGALVCSAAAPRCDRCPLQSICIAAASGDPTAYPESPGAKRWLDIDDSAVALTDDRGRLLITQRPLTAALWGGLWELPRVTRQQDETIPDAAHRALETHGVTAENLYPFGVVKHVVANRRVQLHGFRASLAREITPELEGTRWILPAQASEYAMATPQVRLLALWNAGREQATLEI